MLFHTIPKHIDHSLQVKKLKTEKKIKKLCISEKN